MKWRQKKLTSNTSGFRGQGIYVHIFLFRNALKLGFEIEGLGNKDWSDHWVCVSTKNSHCMASISAAEI